MTKPCIIPISLHQPLKLKSFLYNVSKKLTLASSNDIICNNNIKYNNIYNNQQFLQPRWITPSEICRILHILRKPNSIIVLLFLQNNSKFKNKLKHANLGQCKFISIMHLYREVQENKVCSGLQIYSIQQMLSVKLSSCCSCGVFRQYFVVRRVKCSAPVPPFCSNY